MQFPIIPEAIRLERLEPPSGRIRMILDTDTYNEIDDQFALVYALLSPERLDLETVYAAPFHNRRSEGPGDGMEKSYEEILRLLERMDVSPEGFAFRGSMDYLRGGEPQGSEAVADLVDRAMKTEGPPLYVAAVGAITNVASAILMEPRIIEKIVVVWLGGQPLQWPTTKEFNLGQDVPAARVIFDSGVPLVRLPCHGVTSHLLVTLPELERYVEGRSAIGDYLVEIFRGYSKDHFGYAKEIWDISAIAYLLEPEWTPSVLVHSPILTDQVTWSFDSSRHFIRDAVAVRRNAIFRDLYTKLGAFAART